ncbi:ATP-binding cassette domain-containing protein [Labedella populi]|uniref:ATP-binding cassette domain-containing protein n=1 Tax=Labedella populi TaxID=2498850 RepID=UPI001AA080F7|nr:ATP-binding cassette domain-containing protein [Labedella populi]
MDDVGFAVHPGRITGLLGPNGAGKTTTLRMLLGLAAPDSGDARVLGRRFRDLDSPARIVGAVLDAGGLHPGRTGRQHLRIAAARSGDGRVPDGAGVARERGPACSRRYTGDALTLAVRNTPATGGRALGPDARAGGERYGLADMEERAGLIHVTLTTGPTADGGWANTLVIPDGVEDARS